MMGAGQGWGSGRRVGVNHPCGMGVTVHDGYQELHRTGLGKGGG